MFPVGSMRERVTFQREVRTEDGAGGSASTWSDIATVFASVDAASGQEGLASQQLQASVTYRLRARYRADITAAERIDWQGKRLNIRSITQDNRKEFMQIIADEGEGT